MNYPASRVMYHKQNMNQRETYKLAVILKDGKFATINADSLEIDLEKESQDGDYLIIQTRKFQERDIQTIISQYKGKTEWGQLRSYLRGQALSIETKEEELIRLRKENEEDPFAKRLENLGERFAFENSLGRAGLGGVQSKVMEKLIKDHLKKTGRQYPN